MSVDPVFGEVVRLGLAVLFGSAALHKLRDLPAFSVTLGEYRIAPAPLSRPLAGCVASAEVAVAAVLLVPGLASPGAAGALVLLAGYSAAIALNLARGRRHIDCGCLGPLRRQPLAPWLLARNAGLAAAALLLLAPVLSRPLLWVDRLSIAAALATLLLLWSALHALPQRSA